MLINKLCPPALIYLIFSITQITIDTLMGMYNTAFVKFGVTIVFTLLLNYLCSLGLGIISWVIVMIPFILMTLIVAILLIVFGLNPTTGKITYFDKDGKPIKNEKEKKNEKNNKNSSINKWTDKMVFDEIDSSGIHTNEYY